MLQDTKEEHIIDVRDASRLGCSMMIPVLLFYLLPYVLIWKDSLSTAFFVKDYLDLFHPFWYLFFSILILLVGVVLHELLHGLAWSIFAKKGWSSISFGIMRPHYVPYCHCNEPLRLPHYIIGALTPLIVLGLAPVVYAWINGNWFFLLFGAFFTVSAIGDLMIVHTMRNLKSKTWVLDHPTEPGYYTFSS